MFSKNSREPLFCFTIDLDWASEAMIEETLNLFEKHEVPVTPFITHRSKIIEERYENKRRFVGLHPNFWNDSTQGKNYIETIENLCKLWPEARGYRSHRWFEDLKFSVEFARRGLKYDSTVCMFLFPNITPNLCISGLVQFPVFFEDRWFMEAGFWDIEKRIIETPGLKILDFHPAHICKDRGTKTFLVAILKLIKDGNFTCFYLDDLYRKFKDEV